MMVATRVEAHNLRMENTLSVRGNNEIHHHFGVSEGDYMVSTQR